MLEKKNNQPLISVIIAVYNNEKYISKALNSVLEQNFSDYEIIVIDDGSTDNTPNILDQYKQKFSQISVIHQKNQWIYASFNNGIKAARGKYIYILNSDDMLFSNSLFLMAASLKKYDYPDLIWTRVTVVNCDDDQNIINQYVQGAENVVERYYGTPDEIHRNWCFFYENDFSVNQANLYRRELMLAHPFRNDVYGADVLFNLSIAEDICSCVVLPEPVYRFNVYLSKRNTSIGKYYEYEHSMFSEFYTGHRNLLKRWGYWDERTQFFFANRRVQQVIHELRSIDLPGCNLSVNDKIRGILNYYDNVILECANYLRRSEEIESRFLFRLRELMCCCVDDERKVDVAFLKELIDDFVDYPSLRYKQAEDMQYRRHLLMNQEVNPNHLGQIFYDQYINSKTIPSTGKVKALWLCNLVIPEFAGGYGMRKACVGGWISGMLSEVDKNDDVEVSFVFPIFNASRTRDGFSNGHRFFSFHFDNTDQHRISEKRIERMEEILEEYCPDIVHIWGTEYPWALEMLRACERRNLLERTVVYIQGLVSVYARSYQAGIPELFYSKKMKNGRSIKGDEEEFAKKGKNEVTILQNAKHVIGRTEWDHGNINAVNKGLYYYYVREILRESFYENTGTWSYNNCVKHQIFMSQAAYSIKGLHHLIQALPLILNVYPDTHIFVAGENITSDKQNPYSAYILELIERSGVDEKITFLGSISENEMIKQYLSANVFLSASSIENSPNSVCEAMILGVPIVASFVGGISSILEHGVSGYLYPENEIEMMAYYTILLFDNLSLCNKLSKNAIKRAEIINSRNEGYNDLLKCYKGIINSNER